MGLDVRRPNLLRIIDRFLDPCIHTQIWGSKLPATSFYHVSCSFLTALRPRKVVDPGFVSNLIFGICYLEFLFSIRVYLDAP